VKTVRLIIGGLLVVFGVLAAMAEVMGYPVLIYYGTRVGGLLGLVCIILGPIIIGPEPYVKYADNFAEGTGWVISWLATIMVVVVFVNVVLRYVFGKGLLALQDLSWYLFGLMYWLGAAFALKHDRHVRVDIFYVNMNPRFKVWVNLLGTVFLLIPWCILGVLISISFVESSFQVMETSPDPGGLPGRWLLKASIPLGFIFLLIQGMSLLFTSLLQLKGKLPLPEEG
jgi:TRAP-type mannitol/chloroaromatic compound transport system permease small subunit